MIIPSYTERFGMFGYNRNVGKCDFIRRKDKDKANPHTVFYSIGFLVPLIIIIISYGRIFITTRKSAAYLRRNSR